jgi:sugar/nucleoside kinase (ribokinase family)
MVDVFLLPQLRREEQSVGLLLRSGGSAANTASWLAHLGRRVAFVGCVGSDGPGRMLQSELEQAGVEPHLRVVPGVETGCVAVEVSEDGERVMRSARGANAHLSPDDILAASDLAPDVVHLTGYALLGPYGDEMLRAAGELASQSHALLSFDPSSLGVIGAMGAARLRELIREARVGLLLPNRSEAEALGEASIIDDAMNSLSVGTIRVVVKCGAHGSIALEHGVPTVAAVATINTVDTTGAGDAFNAGAIDAFIDGSTLHGAARRGNHIASRVIGQVGGRPTI